MRGTVSINLIPLLKQANAGIEQAKATGAAFEPSIIRQNLENLSAYMISGPEVSLIKNTFIRVAEHKVAVRIYHPNPDQSLPVLLHFHGGGHMCGSIDLYDPISRELAIAANAIVICIDYRLAPEHPYPAGIEDCQYLLESYQKLLKGYQFSSTLYIAGDSAGGAICTSLVANYIDNAAIKIDKQILIYPSVDYTMSCPSIVENGQGFLLEADKIRWYFQQYFNLDKIDVNTNEVSTALIKKASPLLGTFDSRMPKTLVITKQAGVSVEHYQFDELIHAYMLLSKLVPEQYHQTYLHIKKFINAE